MNIVFVYALCEPETEIVRYVGKTKLPPQIRLKVHLRDKKRDRKTEWIKSLGDAEPNLLILEIIEGDGCAEERKWIQHYRKLGYNLTNLTDGGVGLYNPIFETRLKISDSQRANWLDPKRREIARAARQRYLERKRNSVTLAK